ncbi:MAG: tetratricopeptide repeat protein [Lachnospiraceae bacterium]|nr:tetratricopeptide repeat protein [Lachnospiraceae bacterium]
MICKKCGAQLNSDERFCYQCGTPVSGQGNEAAAVTTQKRLWLFVLVVVVILLLLVGLLVYKFAVGNMEKHYDEQLALADRYLDELDYDRAIAAYREAITIDPSRTDAYLGLADAYAETDDIEAAIRILEEGSEATGSKKIRRKLEELREKETVQEEIQEETQDVIHEDTMEEVKVMEEIALNSVPELEKMEEFLGRFGKYVDACTAFDCNEVYDKNMHTMLDHLLNYDSCCVNFYTYPVQYPFDISLTFDLGEDPLGRYGRNYYIADEREIDWILYHIFNYTDPAIAEMKETWKDPAVKHPVDGYLYDGTYYLEFGTGEGGFIAQVDAAWYDGEKYRVRYHLNWGYMGEYYPDDQLAPQEAEMLLKEIDGVSYWTILSNKESRG